MKMPAQNHAYNISNEPIHRLSGKNAYIEKAKRLTLEEPPPPGRKWDKLSRAHIEEVLKALEKLEAQWNLK